MSSSVTVGVRVRPLVSTERHEGISFTDFDATSLVFKGQTFTYDHVFGMDLTQLDLYNETAAPMLKGFLEGYNVTVIAYGQTGSGKTFTMGTSDIEQGMDDMHGLIPRFVSDLFENLKSGVEGGKLLESKVTVSFLEIYGEDIYDLNRPGERTSLPVREDVNGGRGIFVEGLQSIEVFSAMGALDLLTNGTKTRYTAATAMNAVSSRSHAVYTINLEQTLQSSSSGDDIHQMNSKLTFVDLAGSERIKKTGAEGQRMAEGIQINSGLFHLGQVINSLADEQKIKKGVKNSFLNYRNSKLTHLLKDALGGNSQTLFLACVSPAEYNESETLSTLNVSILQHFLFRLFYLNH
jgi:kinesin family protein 4/21/27